MTILGGVELTAFNGHAVVVSMNGRNGESKMVAP